MPPPFGQGVGWRRSGRSEAPAVTGGSGRKLLAAASAASAKHFAATDGRHAGAEAVTAGADKAAGLESALHVSPRNPDLAPKSRTKTAARPDDHKTDARRYWSAAPESRQRHASGRALTQAVGQCRSPLDVSFAVRQCYSLTKRMPEVAGKTRGETDTDGTERTAWRACRLVLSGVRIEYHDRSPDFPAIELEFKEKA